MRVTRVAMAIPAASSRDELMRLPVDNCCIATSWLRPVNFKAACENSALTLVLMTAIYFSRPLGPVVSCNIKQFKCQF